MPLGIKWEVEELERHMQIRVQAELPNGRYAQVRYPLDDAKDRAAVIAEAKQQLRKWAKTAQ